MSLCLHIFAGSENVLHQLHVIEHQSQAQGFRIAVELAEDAQGAAQESRVLRFRDVAYTALRRRHEGDDHIRQPLPTRDQGPSSPSAHLVR